MDDSLHEAVATPSGVAPLSLDQVRELLAVSPAGLTESEATARRRRFGDNRPPRPRRARWTVELARQFLHLFALLLWAAALLAWWVGAPQLAIAVVLVVAINGLFSFWQQYRAEQAVLALESLLPRRSRVRRDGVERSVEAEAVALGDVLLLAEGDAIPADARLIQAERLRLDLSTLTGESRPVARHAAPCSVDGRAAAELPNLVLAGSFVVAGRAEAIVFAVGERTQFGRLAALTHGQRRQTSPLQRQLGRLTRIVTLLSLALGVVFFGIGWSTGRLSPFDCFVFALGVIVANVPEGLLPTLSLALAIGVRRMAARRAIVKRLESVEAIGAITTIVSDKTGTLTLNQMTARRLWCGGRGYSLDGVGYDPEGAVRPDSTGPESAPDRPPDDVRELLLTAALCCDARLVPPDDARSTWSVLGDPTEGALLVAAGKAGLRDADRSARPRIGELPFDSVRKRMTTVHAFDGGPIACMKGAPSELLPRCVAFPRRTAVPQTLDEARDEAFAAARALADQGLRVLAVARRRIDVPVGGAQSGRGRPDAPSTTAIEAEAERWETGLTFLGLVGLEDPARPEVPAALAACRQAGVRVVMATGDDGRTAAAIGREIGLVDAEPKIVSGADLDRLSDATLGLLLGRPDVLFARVSPSHKLRLVEAFQARGEVVAVTGDGVNDAPALQRADVGVAMGGRGSDVARAAADVVLLDDNFATIVAAVEEGRSVYDNVKKFVTYIVASNVPEVVPFIAFVLFRIPLPLTVMQILAVDLGTDLLPALALGMESPDSDVMRRPPRSRSEPLLDTSTLLRAYAWLGTIEAVCCLGGFFFVYWLAGWRPGAPMADAGPLYVAATTMSLAGIVACQLGNVLACRSDRRSLGELGLFSNPMLLAAMLVETATVAALIYTPPLARLFHLAPLDAAHLALLATFGPLLLGLEELRKRIVRRRSTPRDRTGP